MKKLNKIIITGVNGFIGSALARANLKKGFQIIGIDLASTSNVSGILYHQLNLINDEIIGLLKSFLPDYFIHCAGIADINYSIRYPNNNLITSVVMTQKILYQVLNANIKCQFIYMSSAAVYGEPQKLPINENDILRPMSPYALHKQMTENICLYFIQQHNMNIKILRVFSAYGPGLKKQLFWDMGKKIILTKHLELFGTGKESRDYIYIDDLVEAVFCVMKNFNNNNGNIINIANGIEITIKQVANIFVKEWGEKEDIISFNGKLRKGNPINWKADINKLKKLGFKNNVSIEKGIKEYIKWFKKEYKN